MDTQVKPPLVHVVHDVDRDGLGAAALLTAQLGCERIRLHPTKTKDVRAILSAIREPGEIFVLDIGAPPTWEGVPSDRSITWVDHHMASWRSAPPANVLAVFPRTAKPTTTMSLLIREGIVTIPGAMSSFVRKLCGADAEFDWGLLFDSLSRTFPDWPISKHEFPALLVGGPTGARVPERLVEIVERETAETRQLVRTTLDAAPTDARPHVVVVTLDDAHGVPLSTYSLELQRRYGQRAVVIVHRGANLYCGRSSAGAGFDFLQHFEARGLVAKGHPYVATVRLTKERIETEVTALIAALGAHA